MKRAKGAPPSRTFIADGAWMRSPDHGENILGDYVQTAIDLTTGTLERPRAVNSSRSAICATRSSTG